MFPIMHFRAPSRPTTPSTFTPVHTPSTISFVNGLIGTPVIGNNTSVIGTPGTPRESSLREFVLEKSIDRPERIERRTETKRVSWRKSHRTSQLPMIYENQKIHRPTTLSLSKK